MEESRVYLRIATPRSLRDPDTRKSVLGMGLVIALMAVLTVWLNLRRSEMAMQFTIGAALWLFLGAIPCVLMIFNSYACIRGDELVYNPLGFYERRCMIGELEKAVFNKGRIGIIRGGKMLFSLPNNAAARQLVSRLRLRIV